MDSGKLDQRITLQSKAVARDAMGGEIITWTDQATVWAAADVLQGREYFNAEKQQSEITIRFRIRFRSDVTSAWRVAWRAKFYDIVDVIEVRYTTEGRQPLPRKSEQHLMARTQANV